jgi:hypothetical protein
MHIFDLPTGDKDRVANTILHHLYNFILAKFSAIKLIRNCDESGHKIDVYKTLM